MRATEVSSRLARHHLRSRGVTCILRAREYFILQNSVGNTFGMRLRGSQLLCSTSSRTTAMLETSLISVEILFSPTAHSTKFYDCTATKSKNKLTHHINTKTEALASKHSSSRFALTTETDSTPQKTVRVHCHPPQGCRTWPHTIFPHCSSEKWHNPSFLSEASNAGTHTLTVF